MQLIKIKPSARIIMEGYLHLKKITFTKVWAVLEEQRLSYYSEFDRKTQKCGTLKGVFFLKDAVVKAFSYGTQKYCISINCSEGKQTSAIFDCSEPKIWYSLLV